MASPRGLGPLVILLAALLHIVGKLSSLVLLPQLGFILALIGITLAFGGVSLLRVTFIPIVFLIFAIPLPYVVEAGLTFQLQLLSSQLGVFFIRLFQIPVYLEGNVIDLGVYKLQVVEACSGLRYLYPLMSLGFLAAYLFQAPVWQRLLVFLSTIPITILMNSFRIGLVGRIGELLGAAGRRRLSAHVRRLAHFHCLRGIARCGDVCPGARRLWQALFRCFSSTKVDDRQYPNRGEPKRRARATRSPAFCCCVPPARPVYLSLPGKK